MLSTPLTIVSKTSRMNLVSGPSKEKAYLDLRVLISNKKHLSSVARLKITLCLNVQDLSAFSCDKKVGCVRFCWRFVLKFDRFIFPSYLTFSEVSCYPLFKMGFERRLCLSSLRVFCFGCKGL